MKTAVLYGCVLYLVAACSATKPGSATQIAFFKLLREGKFLDPSTTLEDLYHISDTSLVTGLKHVTVSICYATSYLKAQQADDAYFASLVQKYPIQFLNGLNNRNVVKVYTVEMTARQCGRDWDLNFKCFVDFVQDFAGVDIDNSHTPGPATQQTFFDIINGAGLIYSGTTIYDVYKISESPNKANEVQIFVDLYKEKDDASYAELIAKMEKTKYLLDQFVAKNVAIVLNVKVMRTESWRGDESFLAFHCIVVFREGFQNKSSNRDSSEKSKKPSSGPRDEPKFKYSNTTPPQQNLEDPYYILGVRQGAPFTEVRQAYRRLLMINHPDKTAGNAEKQEKAKKVIGAFEVLEQQEKKKWPQPNFS